MGKILPLLVILIALGGGAAAGFFLRPPPPEGEAVEVVAPEPEVLAPSTAMTLDQAFAVPVLRGGRTWTHVILTLGIESDRIGPEIINNREPILRDALTEALFLHGSVGDFDGDFTEPLAMNRLRTRLSEAATTALDDPTARVLVVSMVRQQT